MSGRRKDTPGYRRLEAEYAAMTPEERARKTQALLAKLNQRRGEVPDPLWAALEAAAQASVESGDVNPLMDASGAIDDALKLPKQASKREPVSRPVPGPAVSRDGLTVTEPRD